MSRDPGALDRTIETLTRRLLARRTPLGYWEGHLASSALATATAVVALIADQRASRRDHTALITSGVGWLVSHQNDDGGWGDTTLSVSNLSTTLLCWAALGLGGPKGPPLRPHGSDKDGHGGDPAHSGPDVVEADLQVRLEKQARERAERWLRGQVGDLEGASLKRAILDRYGSDRTFSVPILTVLALAGKLGSGAGAWRQVPQLPFELAACPHRCFRWMRLPVVSYALPALVAIGQVRHRHAPTRNPLLAAIRSRLRVRTLHLAREMQPESGGYLEAVPLTAFVVMSLVAAGRPHDPIVNRGVGFLAASARADGSWPIDTNLATWVTTRAVAALDSGNGLGSDDRRRIVQWLLNQQVRVEHPFTHARPGGWAWTNLTGGVPDADDTAGALLALYSLSGTEQVDGAAAGLTWLLALQNSDGGIPTFCRGWGALPFDRSAADLTAHALEAWNAWHGAVVINLQHRISRAAGRAVAYLAREQRPDGSWAPLWFGNQQVPGELNLTYGTARVVSALATPLRRSSCADRSRQRGLMWLLAAQNQDGGWGGGNGAPSSIEETGLAVDALTRTPSALPGLAEAIIRGARWLVEATDEGRRTPASAIGLYFARLWYYEELYPLVWGLKALCQARGSVTLTL
jgi:squalene-hopene/tetraprenyl-beta-curcumene cyclase